MDYCVIHGGYSNPDTLLKQREAERGFGDNVPKQGMGRQSHRIPFLSQSEAKSKNQEAKRTLIPQKHRTISAKRHGGRGETSGTLSQTLSGT